MMVDLRAQTALVRRLAESMTKEGHGEESLDALRFKIGDLRRECEDGMRITKRVSSYVSSK